MASTANTEPVIDYRTSLRENPHLAEYIKKISKTGIEPQFYPKLELTMGGTDSVNVIYPLAEKGLFAHITKEDTGIHYALVEPQLDDVGKKKRDLVQDLIFKKSWEGGIEKLSNKSEFNKMLLKWIDEVTTVSTKKVDIGDLEEGASKVPVTKRELADIKYLIERDVVKMGPLQPLLRDEYVEDMTCIGTSNITLLHKVYDHVETNVHFDSEEELGIYLKRLGERTGAPPSKARPVIDTMLPVGARMNLIYADDVSRRGVSFSIRRYSDKPLSVTELINLGTLNAEIAAYLWICLENKMSMLVCGEAACGKTTTMNAILSFIRGTSKLFTVEDTAEVRAPHDVWQQLLTRDTGDPDTSVEAFHLLRAALRSRPNYIVVGEIRGREGNVAFQAIQTGHPVISTFNATDIQKMIQRLTSTPIDIPVTFIDNLNLGIFHQNAKVDGHPARRIISVVEVVKFSKELNGVITKNVFIWRSTDDTHIFRGLYNSYLLENRIAPLLGYTDKKQIYVDLEERAKVLNAMVRENIFDWREVIKVIRIYQEQGLKGLWFNI